MTPDGLITRDSGEWIKRKHHYLRRYCDMFARSMKGKWDLTFLDLLAGPGRCKIRETNELAPGSPFIALDYPFKNFLFYEADPDCADALSARVATHAFSDRCAIVNRPWQDAVLTNEFNLPTGLTLAFIDPTGISQVPWSAVKVIAANSHIDIMMTIQHGMGITLNQHQYLAKEDDTAADAFLGGNDWRLKIKGKKVLWPVVLEVFANNMKGLGFNTRKWMPVKNSTGLGLYYLCLFSRHPLALRFWDEVVSKDEAGQKSMDI